MIIDMEDYLMSKLPPLQRWVIERGCDIELCIRTGGNLGMLSEGQIYAQRVSRVVDAFESQYGHAFVHHVYYDDKACTDFRFTIDPEPQEMMGNQFQQGECYEINMEHEAVSVTIEFGALNRPPMGYA